MRRLLHFIVPILVFGLGVVAGAWFSIKKRAAEFSAGVERRLAEPVEGGDVSQALSFSSRTRFATENDMVSGIMSAVAEKDPLLRAYQLRGLVNSLNSEQLAIMFERALHVDDRDRRSALLVPLLARWAEIDAAGAKAAVQPYRARARAVWRVDWRSPEIAVNEAWAKALPESALAEAAAAPDAWWALTSAQSSLDALANGDPAKKLAELSKMPASKFRDGLCSDALRALAEKDYAAAEAQLDLVSDPRKRSQLQTDILGKLAERDATAAMDRMIALATTLAGGQPALRLVNKVLRAAAKQSGPDALAAIDRLPEELRPQARNAALIGWAGQHPVEALDWAATNNVNIREIKATAFFNDFEGAGWNSLIMTAFDSDREKTMTWLRSQPPSTERDSLLMAGLWSGSTEQRLAIYAELTPESRKKAVSNVIDSTSGRTSVSEMDGWVKGLPAGPERMTGVQALASLQVLNTPERADSIAEEWPAGPERDAAFRGIAIATSHSDHLRGLEFARRITNPNARANAVAQIASSWLYQNEAAARSWISTTSELTADDKRVLIRQWDER
jgi:hypothetical protein